MAPSHDFTSYDMFKIDDDSDELIVLDDGQ